MFNYFATMKKTISLSILTSLLIVIIVINGCKKDPVIPTLTTAPVSNISVNSLTTGGSISKDGDAEITARGVCYSTSSIPTIEGQRTTDSKGAGSFVSTITGLTPNTLYHIRAYATNKVGTAYGEEVTATTTPILLPTLSTVAVTAVTFNTAVTGGIITSDGNDAITARGVCWSTTANPVITVNKTTEGTGKGTFVSNLTGLLPVTIYHVRSYATNSVGTAYGNDVTFTTSQAVVPTITTTAITSITSTSAISGGNITSDGGGTVTARGVCWSTTTSPKVSGSKTTDGTGTGIFTSNLDTLIPSTTYYVRSYATNSAGTAYGNEISFVTGAVIIPTLTTTEATAVTRTTAVSGGNITSNGGGAVTARGVCWSTTANPLVTSQKTTDGTGNGIFTSNIAGLLPGTTYHIRAYATNSAGTAYGNDISVTTNVALAPTLTTASISSITLTTAVSGGTISSDGGSPVTVRGVCWATTASPTIANSKTDNGTGIGTFSSSITGLQAATTYHVRAYATNAAGTSYGNDLTFMTSPVTTPTIITLPVSSIGLNTGISGGNITNNGGGTVTISGICWSTSQNPTTDNLKTTDGTSLGNFTSTMTGLTKGTTYYVRAYATNSAGTSYGVQVTFNTMIDDIEGNLYKTVTIGSQMWMAENLRATRFNNNTPILNITDNGAWARDSVDAIPAYCWYENNISHKAVDGALYNWWVVLGDNLCPTGWKVPSENDFRTLELYLGVPVSEIAVYFWRGTNQGSMMKTTTGWDPGFNGTNSSGFTGTAGGYRYGATGAFYAIGKVTYWWTSTETAPGEKAAWYRRLDGNNDQTDDVSDADNSKIFRSATHKWGAKFIRCIKN